MAKLGYPLKYEEIERYQWCPVQMDILFMLLSKEIFGWGDEKIREWGSWGAKIHIVTRLMIKYFVSIEILVKNVGKCWRKYYTVGELELEKIDKKERSLIIVLKNFKTHPVHLRLLEGYIYAIGTFVLPREKLKVEAANGEKEDSYRFKLSW